MLIRSRSARLAAIALAAATPLVVSYAGPAFAAGDDAVVGVNFDKLPDSITVSSSKGLSRVTVVLCNHDVVVADSWGGDQHEGDVDVSGPVLAVFIHSGDNTSGPAQELLESLSPGAVKGDSTGAIAYNDENHYCSPSENAGGDDNGGDDKSGDDKSGDDKSGDDTVVESTVVTDPAPTVNPPAASNPTPGTDVLGVTIENAGNPAPAATPSPTVQSNNNSNNVAPEVAGNTLPRTGGGHIQFLMNLALSLLAAGIALRAAFGRRIRSASLPG